jgi:hypothetical protein
MCQQYYKLCILFSGVWSKHSKMQSVHQAKTKQDVPKALRWIEEKAKEQNFNRRFWGGEGKKAVKLYFPPPEYLDEEMYLC